MHTQQPTPLDHSLATTTALDEAYFMPVFGKRMPLCAVAGQGLELIDQRGNRYLDMIGGIAVNVLGHAHPRLTRAICQQAGQLIHCSNYYYIPQQALLAKRLADLSGLDGARVFFGNSGAEANEAAIKLVRGFFYYQGKARSQIITTTHSFHGRTLATATATGQDQISRPFAPLPPGFSSVPFNDIKALSEAISDQTGAVMLELVQGERGVIPADPAYVDAVASLCRETGALLVVDEIQTGMGRTGRFFAYEQYGIKPDIVTLAKGLGGGLPIGAVLANGRASQGFRLGDHGSTFGGNPLACQAALAVLDEIEDAQLVQAAKTQGQLLMQGLRQVAAHQPLISDVRGMGLMVGVSYTAPIAVRLKEALMQAGILIGSVGETTSRLLPPLIIQPQELDTFLTVYKRELEALTT